MAKKCCAALPLILLTIILLAVSATWAAQWPAEEDMRNLSRPPQTFRLESTPFPNWSVFWSAGLNLPVLAYGPPVSVSMRSADAVLALVTHAAGTAASFEEVHSLRVGKLTRDYFREMRDGLPVLSGRADLVLNARGQLMRWSLSAHDKWPTKNHHYLDLNSAAVALSATLAPAQWAVNDTLSYAAWFPDYETHSLKSVYWLRVEGKLPHERWEGIVDATSGEVIMNWPGIQTDVLNGTVGGVYWQPYLQSDIQTGPHPLEAVTVNGNVLYTDSSGAFSVEAGNNAALSTTLHGRWVDVQNGAGAIGSMDSTLTAPFSPLTWNWTQSNASDAELNLYHHVNVVHAWYKVLEPGFTGLDYPVPAVANYGTNYDNAFWSGRGMSFGTGSAYLNFAMFSDVIYHEYTHGVTGAIYAHASLPYVGESGAMNEGWSDYAACSMNGDPYVGEWIGGTFNSYFRTLLSTVVYPRDLQGEVHADSPFISAPLWTIRSQLGAEITDSLFHFARYALATTFVDYFIAVLETDDNDGDLSNGTPHSDVIISAFSAHGIGPGQNPSLRIDSLRYYADGQGGSHGNGNRFIEPGETAEMVFSVTNDAPPFSPRAVGVQINVHMDDQYVTIEHGSQTVDTLAVGHSYAITPVLLHVNANAPDHWTTIQIDITSNGGAVTVHQDIQLTIGLPHLLVVKNDPATNVTNFVTSSLRISDKIFDSVEVDPGSTLPSGYLPEHGVVVWLSGNASGDIITADDQVLIQSYLAAGNRVVLSGQNIADALDGTDFARDVLQIRIAQMSRRTLTATATQSPFTNGEWFHLSGGNGANNQTEETSFVPIGSSQRIIYYGRNGTDSTAGVSFADGKGMLLGFGIEAISGQAVGSSGLAVFLDNIYAWASDVLGAQPAPRHKSVPTEWSIGPVYPNPFNRVATIAYSVPSPRGGELRIFDLMGHQVESRHIEEGLGTVEWKPQGASGVYFAQVKWNGGQTKPMKLMYLK